MARTAFIHSTKGKWKTATMRDGLIENLCRNKMAVQEMHF